MYLCTWYHLALNSTMAKVGYIFKTAGYDGFDTDVEWMKQYGCVQVIEEENGHEKLRPQWKQLMASLERGDEIVLAKFSNALRGSRELGGIHRVLPCKGGADCLHSRQGGQPWRPVP